VTSERRSQKAKEPRPEGLRRFLGCTFVARQSQTFGYAPSSRLGAAQNRRATRPCPILKTRPNPAISLQAFFDRLAESKKIIHVAEDDDGINMGLFFINNHPDAIRLLDLLWIYNLGSHRVLWEQAAFRDLLDNYSQIRNILSLAESPKEFNSFPKERQAICGTNQTNNWSEGDFVCHFSGLKSPDLEKMIAHYVSTYSIKLTL